MKAERFLERKSQKDFKEKIWTDGKGLFVCLFLGGRGGRWEEELMLVFSKLYLIRFGASALGLQHMFKAKRGLILFTAC